MRRIVTECRLAALNHLASSGLMAIADKGIEWLSMSMSASRRRAVMSAFDPTETLEM